MWWFVQKRYGRRSARKKLHGGWNIFAEQKKKRQKRQQRQQRHTNGDDRHHCNFFLLRLLLLLLPDGVVGGPTHQPFSPDVGRLLHQCYGTASGSVEIFKTKKKHEQGKEEEQEQQQHTTERRRRERRRGGGTRVTVFRSAQRTAGAVVGEMGRLYALQFGLFFVAFCPSISILPTTGRSRILQLLYRCRKHGIVADRHQRRP